MDRDLMERSFLNISSFIRSVMRCGIVASSAYSIVQISWSSYLHLEPYFRNSGENRSLSTVRKSHGIFFLALAL